MKRILTLVCIAFVGIASLSAQSLIIKRATANVTFDPSEFETDGYAWVINTTDRAIAVKAIRAENALAQGAVSKFCWDFCYGPLTDESIGAINLAPGDSTNALHLIFSPNGTSGTSTVTMRFANRDSLDEFVEQTFTFQAITTDIDDDFNALQALSAPYPNPARDHARIRYELPFGTTDAQLKVFNLVGREIRNIPLSGTSSEARIETGDLKSGVYFVYLHADNKQITSKKLIVRH